jgi:hypothetical protein
MVSPVIAQGDSMNADEAIQLPDNSAEPYDDTAIHAFVLAVYTVVIFSFVLIFVGAFWAYVLYPPNWGQRLPRVSERLGGYLMYAFYSLFVVGKTGMLAGIAEGIWFALRIRQIRSLFRLLVQAIAITSLYTLMAISYLKGETSPSRVGDFGCGAEFWWFAWLVLSSTAAWTGYCLRARILTVESLAAADSER